MLREALVTAFLATTDLERARRFFEGVLGLTVESQDDFALVLRTPGSTGSAGSAGSAIRVTRVQQITPAPYTVLGWSVADLRRTLEDLRQRGVTFTRYPGMNQDELGVWTAPSGARVAWFADPDGNVLSLTEH